MIDAMIVHRTPGRIRIRIAKKQGNTKFFAGLAEDLKEIDDVHAVKANATTGSAVVQFNGDIQPLIDQMRERGLNLTIESEISAVSRPSSIRPVRLVTGHNINPMFMLGSALTAVGIMQTLRGKVAVPSITAFWYALDAYRSSRKAE